MTLCLIDLKQYMYTGVNKRQTCTRGVVEDSHKYRAREFRCGSLGYMIDEIYRMLKNPDNCLCFCIDTSPTYKREMSLEKLHRKYKDGRQKPPAHVTYQFEFAQRMIKAIGFNYAMIDGYEADDGISSVIRKYGQLFDKIVIYSNDSDQYYLVNERTKVLPTSLRGKEVSLSNYETVVNKDRFIPYNTITLDKMIYSEMGDNIPSISRSDASLLMRLIPRVAYPFLGDNEILRTIIKNSTKDEFTLSVFDMIAPVEITDERVQIELGKTYNGELLRFFGIEFQSYACYNYNKIDNEIGEEMIEDFLDELVAGEVI